MSNKISESIVPSANAKLIDVEKAIASKNPKILKFLTSFVLSYIKKVLHEDELNDANNRNSNSFELDFVDAAINEFGVNVKVIGEENIPKTGGIIIVANHPLGALDGIAFMKAVGKHRKDIRFLVNDLLLAIKNFGQLFIPVNKHGKNSEDYIEMIDKVYASSNCILLFPAGLVSRMQKAGVIEDLIWKKSFISKAIKYEKNIVPVYIDGCNSNFFYNLDYWRKKIGIGANLEMFYLVDEMYKQKGKTITFTFGEEIKWQTFTNNQRDEYWSKRVKSHVYGLKNGDKSKMIENI